MPQIFQLTEEDVIRHNFDPEDVGTWCFVMNGCVLGFAGSRDAAEDMLTRHHVHRFNPVDFDEWS